MTAQHDTSHLVALHERLVRERRRLTCATSDEEKALRRVWVEQAERELAGEMKFLGIADVATSEAISDDDLLAALGA